LVLTWQHLISAALIQQSTTVKRKDIRKFLDGIYVSQKTTIAEDEQWCDVRLKKNKTVKRHRRWLFHRSFRTAQDKAKQTVQLIVSRGLQQCWARFVLLTV